MSLILSNEGVTVHPIVVPTKFSLKSFNFYLVEQADSLTLIDGGIPTDECWEYLENVLAKNDLHVSDITQVLLTHNHEDHVGIINRITDIKDVPVYAHADSIYRLKRDKDYFALRIDFFKQLYEEMDCGDFGTRQIEKITKLMSRNEKNTVRSDIIPIAENDIISGLKVFETPGHSPDHIVFFDEQKKELFGGDHLVSHISSNAIVEPDRDGRRIQTLSQYVQSLQKCSNFEINLVYPGHGELIRNSRELFNYRLERIHLKSDQVLTFIKEGYNTGKELAQVFYKEKYKSEFALVMSEIVGHLDYLESNHKVEKVKKKGVWHYKAS
ncbi:MBL fold metallo-hydrolase [Bacillus sp. AGMB 02131]|uniref:MBL fold metallo-hydrolase n=1 Tax=Peribacillus faecalis TaxID=2772559 RepID=A0A927CZQ9_9BACI|nr:MBL fold metallo-hydrolase [Peribacillus faecalis]